MNECGVGVDSQYFGFIRHYLAELRPNLNDQMFLKLCQYGNLAKEGNLSEAHAPGWFLAYLIKLNTFSLPAPRADAADQAAFSHTAPLLSLLRVLI
jgi:hypothetical protein